jgi:hypothetical protein
MIPVLKKMVALALCVSMAACTSMHVVADGPAAVTQVGDLRTDGLAGGDTLRIVGYDGHKQILEFKRIEHGALLGQVDGKDCSIALDQVERIEREQIDAPKTTGLVVALTTLTLVLLHSLANSMANSIVNNNNHK